MTRAGLQKIAGVLGLMLAALLLLVGAGREHKAHDREAEEDFEMVIFAKITERELTEDATFSGVVHDRDTGRMYSTYDRTKPRGKKACPT